MSSLTIAFKWPNSSIIPQVRQLLRILNSLLETEYNQVQILVYKINCAIPQKFHLKLFAGSVWAPKLFSKKIAAIAVFEKIHFFKFFVKNPQDPFFQNCFRNWYYKLHKWPIYLETSVRNNFGIVDLADFLKKNI